MKKIIKFIILSSIIFYSTTFASIGFYGNHVAPYTDPGITNLGGLGPNMGTFCNDDGDGDGSNNKLANNNDSSTTDAETGLLTSIPDAGNMRCLYWDAVAPTGVDSYDLSRLNTDQEITVTIQCADTGGSGCDTSTNDTTNIGLGWSVSGLNTYKKVCTGINLSGTVTISNTSSCAGPITFRDKSGRTTNFTYQISGPTPSLPQLVSTQLKIRGISQLSSNTNAAGIKANDGTNNTDIKDNFSKISKLDLKTTINKNVNALLKSVNRKSIGYSSVSFNLSSINGQDKDIVSGSKKIYYYKDKNVTINAGANFINNKNITIIIERGNLFIKGDIDYQNGGMLGIILLGNIDGTKSKVFIDEKITNGAGIIYTDGTIQGSYNNSGTDENIYTASNINDRGLNQLYWKGSFLSQNTIGGSIGTAKCPYGTTEYISKTCNTNIAKKYDLLLFRRYSLIDGAKYYGITSAVSPFTTTSLPFGSKTGRVKISGGREYSALSSPALGYIAASANGTYQDKNISNSFILDYDSRISSKTAPLGFIAN